MFVGISWYRYMSLLSIIRALKIGCSCLADLWFFVYLRANLTRWSSIVKDSEKVLSTLERRWAAVRSDGA